MRCPEKRRRLAAANGFLQQAADAPRIGREIGYLDGFAAFIIETVARWAIKRLSR
jgi:hypothetical protein